MSEPFEQRKTILDDIIQEVKFEGFSEGTESFEKRRRQLHVIKCRDIRGVVTCGECNYHDSCSLYAKVKYDHFFDNE